MINNSSIIYLHGLESTSQSGKARQFAQELLEADGVACYGIGLEQRLSSRLVLYGGAAHNESAYVPERDSFAAWDLTDVTGGFTVETDRATLAFGLGYAWGTNRIPQAVVPPDETEPAVLREAHFSRWTISVGASFH